MELMDYMQDGSIEKLVCILMYDISQQITKSTRNLNVKYNGTSVWVTCSKIVVGDKEKVDAEVITAIINAETKRIRINIHKDTKRFKSKHQYLIDSFVEATLNQIVKSSKVISELGYGIDFNEVNMDLVNL